MLDGDRTEGAAGEGAAGEGTTGLEAARAFVGYVGETGDETM
jgi:hypothetical protein